MASAPLLLGASAGNAAVRPAEDAAQTDKWLWIPGHAFTMKAVGRDTGKVYTWVLAENKPREGVVLHQHSREDEVLYILDGRFELTIGGQTSIGTPGSFFFGRAMYLIALQTWDRQREDSLSHTHLPGWNNFSWGSAYR